MQLLVPFSLRMESPMLTVNLIIIPELWSQGDFYRVEYFLDCHGIHI